MRCNSGAQLLGRHVFEVFPENPEADDGARNLRCLLLTASSCRVAQLRTACLLLRLFDAMRWSSLQLPVPDRQLHKSRQDRP